MPKDITFEEEVPHKKHFSNWFSPTQQSSGNGASRGMGGGTQLLLGDRANTGIEPYVHGTDAYDVQISELDYSDFSVGDAVYAYSSLSQDDIPCIIISIKRANPMLPYSKKNLEYQVSPSETAEAAFWTQIVSIEKDVDIEEDRCKIHK